MPSTTTKCFACGGPTEEIDGLDVCVDDCSEPDDEDADSCGLCGEVLRVSTDSGECDDCAAGDADSYRDDMLREHEDWFRGDR